MYVYHFSLCQVWFQDVNPSTITLFLLILNSFDEILISQMLGGDDHDLGHMGMFKAFMKQHNKSYKTKAEFKRRFKIFHQNMKKVHILQQNERGTAKYGPTKFADLTGELMYLTAMWDFSGVEWPRQGFKQEKNVQN